MASKWRPKLKNQYSSPRTSNFRLIGSQISETASKLLSDLLEAVLRPLWPPNGGQNLRINKKVDASQILGFWAIDLKKNGV